MNLLRISLFLLSVGITPLLAQAARGAISLIEYDTTNPNGANGAPSPNLNAASSQYVNPLQLSRGAGVVPNVGIAFNSRDWSLENTLNLASDKYIQWGWSGSSHLVDLTSMTIQYDISPSGPVRLAIAVSINGGSQNIIFTDDAVDPSDETHTIDLRMFDQVSSAVFRLYGFAAASSAGTLDIEEIIDGGARGILIDGELSVVPEPAAGFVTMMAVTAILFGRRRQLVGNL